MVQAVVFDIDNTLTDNTSWMRITECLGASPGELGRIFSAYLKGEIAHEEAIDLVVDLWRSGGKADKSFFEEIFATWPLKDGAVELVEYIASKGIYTALITGSVDLFALAIAKRLSIQDWYANSTLKWDGDGQLMTFEYIKDQAALKRTQLETFAKEHNIPVVDCVVVADGENDIETFRATGKGIAVGSNHPALLKVASKQVDQLSDVRAILESL